jgi:hypothetical protein
VKGILRLTHIFLFKSDEKNFAK